MRFGVVCACLITVAVAQVGQIAHERLRARQRLADGAAPVRMIAVGEAVGQLKGKAVDGHDTTRTIRTPDGAWTVLLAFKSSCPFCEDVAPLWREWLARHAKVRVVAVTRDPLRDAVEYRDRHGWQVDLLSVAGAPRESIEGRVVVRTPWIFLLDGAGIVRFTGHGERLAAVDSMLLASRQVAALHAGQP